MRGDTTVLPKSIRSASLAVDAGRTIKPRTIRRTTRVKQLEHSVHAFYRTLKEPDRLDNALLGTARAFGGDVAHFIVADADGYVRTSHLVGNVPDNAEAVEAEYRAINPRIAAGRRVRPGELTYDAAHSTPDEIARDPAYQELFRQWGIDWYVGTPLIKDERAVVLFGTFRPAREGHFSKDEMRAFEWVAQHAATAVDLLLMRDVERLRGAAASLEAFGACCAAVDARGRVIEASQHFLELSKKLALFRLEGDGTFVCADPTVNARLGALLCGLTAESIMSRPGLAAQLVTTRTAEGTLWRVRASPLPEGLPWIRRPGRCLITIDEISYPASDESQAQALIEAFALTRAEASVAVELAEGIGLPDVAARRGVSYHTVRNQAKSIFSKTGCRTQAELSRLLARLFA